jgi:hypothetical protein
MKSGASALSAILVVLVLCLLPFIGVAVNETARVHTRWILGTDAPRDAFISGNTVSVDLDVEQGTPVNFTEVLFLKNQHGTRIYGIEISLGRALPTSEFDECKIHVYENSTASWLFVDTIDLADESDTFNGSLEAGSCLRMSFEVKATASAGGTYCFRVKIGYS